jgi:hypothetical protein
MPTDTAYRVQDILAAAQFLRGYDAGHHSADLIAFGEAGLWAVFAAALDGDIAHTVADLNGFNPEDDAAWVARHYVPCIRSLGDMVTAAYFIAPRGLWLMNADPAYGTARLEKAFIDTGTKSFHYTAEVASTEDIASALN